MAKTFTLIDGVDEREFEPFNYNEIEISETYKNENGSWYFLTECGEISIIGADYEWLLARLMADRCGDFYVKVECNNALQYYGKYNYYTCNIDYDHCIIDIKPTHESYLTKVLAVMDNIKDLRTLVADTLVIGGGYTYNNAKRLNDVINAFLAGTGVTLQSVFLQNQFSPEPFRFPVGTFEAPFDDVETINNKFNFLYLTLPNHQLNRTMEMSLSDLLKELCKSLPLRWTVDETNAKLIIEHVYYFQLGKKYTGTPNIALDITTINGGLYLEETNKINFIETKFPKYEKHSPKYNGFYLRYGVNFINDCVQEYKQEDFMPLWENDPYTVETEEVDCVMLLGCYDNIVSKNIWVKSIPSITFINYYFSDYVLIYYWLYDRLFERVYSPVGSATWWNTITKKPYKKQEGIQVPLCCNQINNYERVKTAIGNAMIDKIKYNVATGQATLNLKYDDI